MKIIKHVVENCYGYITYYARVFSCCTSDHLRACHQKPCIARCHLGCSLVAVIKTTQISVLLLWIDGIMESVQKGLPSLSLNLLLVIKMVWEEHLTPRHSSMFWTKSFSCSSQEEDGKSQNTLGINPFMPFTV